MPMWLMVALQATSAAPVTVMPDAAPARALTFTVMSGCNSDEFTGGDIIVCGRMRDRYRLPLPNEREPVAPPERNETQTGMAALTPAGRCGIFAGDRRCGNKEAAEYGYGNGRDPISLLTRLARKAVDPDTD